MLKKLEIKFLIGPIIEQVLNLGDFGKSLVLNETFGNLFSGPYTVKNDFINTPLGNLLNSLENIGEARLLKLASGETYTAHSDPDDRYHLSIITNPFAYLIDLDDNYLYHIPVDGHLWYMDTSKIHVAANFGPRDRIHLNIRVLLPKLKTSGFSLSLQGGDFDWKQQSYIELMSFLNKGLKNKSIFGIEKFNDREIFLNCDLKILTPIITKLEEKGFTVVIKKV